MDISAAAVMTFEKFVELLELKFSLTRELHVLSPLKKAGKKKQIAAIDRQLYACPMYNKFFRRYVQASEMVG